MEEIKNEFGNSYVIETEGGTPILEANAPDLDKLTASVIIPDYDKMEVNIVSFDYILC